MSSFPDRATCHGGWVTLDRSDERMASADVCARAQVPVRRCTPGPSNLNYICMDVGGRKWTVRTGW